MDQYTTASSTRERRYKVFGPLVVVRRSPWSRLLPIESLDSLPRSLLLPNRGNGSSDSLAYSLSRIHHGPPIYRHDHRRLSIRAHHFRRVCNRPVERKRRRGLVLELAFFEPGHSRRYGNRLVVERVRIQKHQPFHVYDRQEITGVLIRVHLYRPAATPGRVGVNAGRTNCKWVFGSYQAVVPDGHAVQRQPSESGLDVLVVTG